MSLRELAWMARGRMEHDWSQSSELLAALVNPYRDPKKRSRPYTADELNPMIHHRKRQPIKDTKTAFEFMRRVFVERNERNPNAKGK